jgi:hypothetical protein
MAVTKIAYKPELTSEQAMEIFRRRFEGKYEVLPTSGLQRARRDFWVKKNAFIGVAVRIEQGQGETKFVYTGNFPSFWAMLLTFATLFILIGIIAWLGCYLLWNGLTGELRSFIESAPEFH